MAQRAGIDYRRIPGRGPRRAGLFSGLFSRCRLYLGPDHLLAVDNHSLSEDYKRFYFTDIQAIITQRTPRWIVSSVVLFLLASASLGIGLLVHGAGFRIFWRLLTTAMIACTAINLLRGPTCACRIMTAVQEDLLPSLTRVRVARKVIDGLLRPLIEGAQGSLRPEDLAAAEKAGLVTQRRDDPLKASAGEREARMHAGYRGIAHILAFSLFMADGILTGIDLVHHAAATIAISNIANTGGVVCIIIALVKQRGSMLSKGVRNTTWAAFAFVCLSSMLGYWLGVFAMVQAHGPVTNPWMINQWDMYRALLRLSPQGSPFLMAVYSVEAAAAFILGALGLVLVLKARPARAVSAGPHLTKEFVHKP